jgi:hypothetical protein
MMIPTFGLFADEWSPLLLGVARSLEQGSCRSHASAATTSAEI